MKNAKEILKAEMNDEIKKSIYLMNLERFLKLGFSLEFSAKKATEASLRIINDINK
jgi:hypothetical protein